MTGSLPLAVLALVLANAPATAARIHDVAAAAHTRAANTEVAQARRRVGPFATLRRANEVANHYLSLGLNAVAFHSGDGYYVDVW